MKAAVLHALGTPLTIETVPDPMAGPGEVVAEVVAALAGESAAALRNLSILLRGRTLIHRSRSVRSSDYMLPSRVA